MSRTCYTGQREILYTYSAESFIVTIIHIDSSSKHCFEEKSNKVNYDKIFQKSTVDIFRCSHGFQSQRPSHTVPAKKCRRFYHESQNFKEKGKKQSVLKSIKSAKHKHYKVGFQRGKN